MKKLKELKIMKKQLSVIENSNEDLEIDDLFILDARDFKDNFFLENIKLFIKIKCSLICQRIISSFDKEKLEPYLEELINVIVDSDNYNTMIDLLNYDKVVIKDNDDRPLNNFDKQKNIMLNKILDSNDPIVYLRAAIYYYGMTWRNMNFIPFKKRREIENIILSYDFKKFNLNFGINRYHDRTKEPYTYFKLLIIYCRDYYKGYWLEAEQKVFKFVPLYMDEYIEQVVKGKNERIEDILLEMNIPDLYFSYAKNNLKKEWEDFRKEEYLKHSLFSIKEEIIDAALNSISSDARLAMEYAKLFKKRLSSEMENTFFIELNKKIDFYNNHYFNFVEDIIKIYLYIKEIKESFPLFEEFLIKLNDLKGGLKLDEPYEEDIENEDEIDGIEQFRKLLHQIIYNYTITNRNKVWSEIGINNKDDLLKLKAKIIEGRNIYYQLKISGYGELDL